MGLVEKVIAKNKEYKESLEKELQKEGDFDNGIELLKDVEEDKGKMKKEKSKVIEYPEERMKNAFKNMKKLQDEISKMGEIVDDLRGGDDVEDKLTSSLDWDILTRMTDAFCSVMESPALARKLTNETYTQLVKNQVSFFGKVQTRYWNNNR